MINFLAPYIPHMTTIRVPLQDLVKTDVHFQWNPQADSAWKQVKDLLSADPVLQCFDPAMKCTIQANAS